MLLDDGDDVPGKMCWVTRLTFLRLMLMWKVSMWRTSRYLKMRLMWKTSGWLTMLKDDVDMEQLLLDEVEVTCLKKTVM